MNSHEAQGWPELKQFGDLTVDDFARCPAWISCHVQDYDEPWYDETDEETFRPWTGPSRSRHHKECCCLEQPLRFRTARGTRVS
jgi:hypothetical protein